MNIKSLILGSAAAIIAAGSAQAADLPVAEPVDYVKVCGAYGAGYFFIPGTDNCLRISGNVEFGVEVDDRLERMNRSTNAANLYTDINVTFDAKRETELGTLTAHIEMDAGDIASGTTNVNIDKAYIQLGGFYAGVTDSIINYNAGVWYDDHSFDGGDINVVGYAAALGNGVTLTVAVEEAYTAVGTVAHITNTPAPGWTFPRLAAEIAVAQGWGSVEIGGAIHQVRYGATNIDSDYGYAIGGEASFDLMEGLTFGIAGGYSKGGAATDVVVNGASTSLKGAWAASAALTYAASEKLTVGIDAGITDQTAGSLDRKDWTVSGGFNYVVVDNLTLTGKVGYNKRDFDKTSSSRDLDGWVGRVMIVRDF